MRISPKISKPFLNKLLYMKHGISGAGSAWASGSASGSGSTLGSSSASENGQSLERVNAFSDGVFAIIITIMVLELKKPEEASFKALLHLWPTWVSYIASYAFTAVVWVNHHFLLKKEIRATWRLVWANFGHMFAVSLIPFITMWMAETRLAALPVALYAFDFFLVNVTYIGLIYESHFVSGTTLKAGQLMRVRSICTLALFLLATGLAFAEPLLGFLIVCACLGLYLRPDIPSRKRREPVEETVRIDLL